MAPCLSKLVQILETYRGRDKIIRLLSYTALFVGGSLNNSQFQSLGQSLSILASNLFELRTMLRLFDDLSMYLHCRKYGLGSQEKDLFIRLTTLVSNFFGQAYYIVEHIAWSRDKKILAGNSTKLWTIGICFWLISLCISIAQSLWHLRNLANEVDNSEEALDALKQQKLWYYARQRQLIVTIVGCLGDGCNAVNWLPKGILWSGQFSRGMIGFMGMISSSALMYNYLNPVPPKEGKEGEKKQS